MKHFAIHLPDGARLEGYVHEKSEEMDNTPRPAVIVCPGGAYAYCSDREADPVALAFFARGFHSFVLYYPVGEEAQNYRPLISAARAVSYLRKNAEKYNVAQIAVCGFSAGGHLALSTALLYDRPELKEAGTGGTECRPDAVILGYPVVTCSVYTEQMTCMNVTGSKDPTPEREIFSLEKHIRPDTPPVFLWHCVGDTCVPVENAVMLIEELQRNRVPYEAHLFADGNHGMSMCTREVGTEDRHVGKWFSMCCEWLEHVFEF